MSFLITCIQIKEDYAGISLRPARNYRLSGVKFSLRARACGRKYTYLEVVFSEFTTSKGE